MHDSILQSVGWTPLVRLRRLAADVPATVCVKVESLNPGGSVKDRVGVAMVAEAEQRGWLRPGGTIIEATAGNTGVGLALVAAVKGYRCIFVLPDKMSSEKILLLKAYGAEVVVTPTNVPPDSPDSYNGVADRLAREIPGAWRPNQFANLANPEIHYRTTGPEIWEQTEGRVTAFVAGVGTGGTVSGVGEYLKERNPNVKIVGADPEGSVLSGGSPKPWKVEGIGEDFVPQTFNSQVVDDWVRVGDAEAFHVARELARREGILSGGSSGTSVAAALRYARRLTKDDVVVGVICDTGRNYLSKFFDDEWLKANNLLLRETAGPLDRRPGEAARPAAAGVDQPGGDGGGGHRAVASDRHLAVAGAAGRPVGRQRPGGDAGAAAARRHRPGAGEGGRRDGPAAAAGGGGGASGRGVPPFAIRQHRRAGGRGRQGGGHRDADRFGAVLGRDAAEVNGGEPRAGCLWSTSVSGSWRPRLPLEPFFDRYCRHREEASESLTVGGGVATRRRAEAGTGSIELYCVGTSRLRLPPGLLQVLYTAPDGVVASDQLRLRPATAGCAGPYAGPASPVVGVLRRRSARELAEDCKCFTEVRTLRRRLDRRHYRMMREKAARAEARRAPWWKREAEEAAAARPRSPAVNGPPEGRS